jgi:hypothetical protein
MTIFRPKNSAKATIFQDLTKQKKSSTVEAHILRKLGQVFTLEKGRTLGLSLFFTGQHLGYHPCV